ncbi:unnamed protein product [Arctia plantaginis]|uniref:FAD-binding PCMH-type domain-containing protein n=1 Tax=Arctia plantaginis TaxID=874455 RepID=A0A8S0Z5J5_ARCPL|nr:unnamed protein product [Arctia plantaginis]
MAKIDFKINGKQYEVDGRFGPDVSLNEYIRDVAHLRGTKAMCHEGGCGICIVAVRAALPPTNEVKLFSVNSCLVSVLSCHGWDIITVEGVGNRLISYHEIQSRLAKFNGTQCGYCTPGWIMNMYSLYETKKGSLTQTQIENSFASNICRCTGYRAIADAFKTFAQNIDEDLNNKLIDLEDLSALKTCKKQCLKTCDKQMETVREVNVTDDQNWCVIEKSDKTMIIVGSGKRKWFKPFTLDDVFKIIVKNDDYKLIAGNTGQGVYHIQDYPPNVIDIFNVVELKGHSFDVNLILGAGMTLSEMMELFNQVSSQDDNFSYLKIFYDHMDLVAHIPVRNIGTIGGNLFIKYENNDFQSDLFLLFETVGGMVTIAESTSVQKTISFTDFVQADMKRKVIINVMLPPLSSKNNKIKTYKQFKTLSEEITPDEAPPEPSAAYRKMLATALYYKAILSLCPDGQMSKRYRTGGEVLKRNTSRGGQIFDTDKTVWPLNQPIPKLEALVQCSGEATFSNDLPKQPNEVFAAFVTADVRPGSIISGFDTTEAFKITGVVAFYSAKDIPGNNSFTPLNVPLINVNEEILCSKVVKFYGDPVGIIVATREKTANKAAKLVKVNYESISENKPLLTIDDVLNSPERNKRVINNRTVQPEEIGKDVKHVISGELKLESQFHFYMEPQTCVVRPTEDGLEVSASTQWLDLTNVAVAQCLNVPVNSINVVVRRVGGGYGGKITRSCQVACSAALVTHLLGRTCRFILPLETGMKIIGKRLPTTCNFQVGVNNDGEIQYLKNIFYQDNGCGLNEVITAITVNHVFNCYDTRRWYVEANSLTTDTASNTWCRAPASTEGLAMTEYIMEKIAHKIGKDPLEVRLANMSKENNPVPDLLQQLMKDCNYDERIKEVKTFNDENRWRKRALKVIPMTYDLFYIGPYNSLISVYHADGSVVITHGGIEMGQGINTKTAQVCAYKFGISVEKISVKPSSSFTSPNMMATGASVGSECIAFATMKACDLILERLAPIREKMKDPTWEDLVEKAFQADVDLQASYMFSSKDDVKPYDIYGACALEVEVDILTGNHDIRRVDLLEDTGRSLNPVIDVTQIEGAFVMGIGYWTSEKIVYDPNSGKLLTDRTWNYKPPGIKDIPADFRNYFRRNSKNPCGVLQSKATGEPALCLAVVITHALREAVRAARLDAGYEDQWVNIQNPCTVENIFTAVGHKLEHFTLK